MTGGRRESVALYARMTHSLLASGYGLNDTVRLLARNDLSPRVRAIARLVGEGLRKGSSFSASVADARDGRGKPVFAPDIASWITAAERTGSLLGAFESLNLRFEAERETAERFVSALLYPAFVVALSAVGTGFAFAKALPFMRSLGLLDSAAGAAMARGIAAAFAVLLALSASFALVARKLIGKESSESLIFARLEDYARAGLPASEAIPGCVALLGGGRFAEGLVAVRRDLASGKPLAAAFRECGLFPVFVTDLMAVGSDTGDLRAVFSRAREFYAARDRSRREAVLRLSEPVAIAITGAYLAIILEAAVVPLLTAMGGIV